MGNLMARLRCAVRNTHDWKPDQARDHRYLCTRCGSWVKTQCGRGDRSYSEGHIIGEPMNTSGGDIGGGELSVQRGEPGIAQIGYARQVPIAISGRRGPRPG